MTVTSSTNSASYAGDGVSTTFTVPFRFLEDSHLLVVLVDADGTEHTQVLNTDYTASGAGDATGGVTFSAAPASGKTVQIFRNVPITQEKDYVAGDKFPAESHENALDKLTMIAQQQGEKLGRSWLAPYGETAGTITAGAEGTVPKYDAEGNQIEGPSAAEIESAEGYAEAAEAALASFNEKYLGAFADDTAATAAAGGSPITGALYFNTGDGKLKAWGGTGWQELDTSLDDGEVTEAKIGAGAVTTGKVADGAVTTAKLAAGAATLAKIGDDAKADFRLVDPNGPRIPVGYYGPTSVQIVGVRSIAMGGFRHKGRYKVGRAPVFDMPAFDNAERHIIDLGNGTSTAGDLFAEAYHAKSCFYAQFSAANDGDATATNGSMPFLRVGSVSGNVITLNKSGENERSVAAKTHQFTTDALVGCDVLVITETLNSRDNAFSGRMTTVTANTQTTVTLAEVGTMNAYDYFLVAPPGYDHYCYLNACYIDTAEVRNIADSGTIVHTRGSDNTDADINGAIAAGGVDCRCDGHVSPLATGVFFNESNALSSSEVGAGYSQWGMDNSHDSIQLSWQKVAAASQAAQLVPGLIPFSFSQLVNFRASGDLNTSNNVRNMQMRGWIEL